MTDEAKAPAAPRLNEDGKLLTWTVYGIESGEPILVDDRTYDPKHHSDTPPGAEPAKPAKKAKGE